MLDYVFFAKEPCDKFIDYLSKHQVSLKSSLDDSVRMIKISEDLDPTLIENIERYYDEMMEHSSKLLPESNEEDSINTAGLTITLNDGQVSYAVIDPEIINKILTVLELDELNTMVNAIVDAVESPNATQICQRTPTT